MFFTSKEAAQASSCTLRQLQYWRERRVVIPTVDAIGKGRSVFYTEEDLVSLTVMGYLLSAGVDFQEAVHGLEALKEKEPEFYKPSCSKRYMLSRHSSTDSLELKEFNVEDIHNSLLMGQPVIPVWLDQIHQKLQDNLQKVVRFREQNQEKMPVESEEVTRRERIDNKLMALNWIVISYKDDLDLNLLQNHAVTEYPVATGRADYALFVHGQFLGIIEAKRLTVGSQSALEQAKRYSKGVFDGVANWRGYRVPFLFSSNGELIFFLDVRLETNLSRQVSNFHTPEALEELFKRDCTESYHWLENHLIEENARLRPYQVEAIAATEAAIIQGKRNLLLAMATGTGKTFCMVSQIYRFLASKTVKRVLFLVDRRALAAQAVSTIAAFNTPRGNKFNQEYEVYSQAFKQEDFETEAKFDPNILPVTYLTQPNESHTFVYVCTIQRMKINLFGRGDLEVDIDGDIEDESDATLIDTNIPIHAFDLIVADECHRGYTSSETGSWRKVIDYFDAIKIGLTATPALHTVSVFKEIVYRYTTEQAIADGWLVDYEQINIDSQIRINGTFLREDELVGLIDQETGEKLYERLEDERAFTTTEIERKITVPDSNRKIIEEVAKYAYQHEQETGHFPKILIFATNDLPHISHADQLVSICREVFARGDDFAAKITGKVDRPLQKIQEFRNRPQPQIVVTVDLLTTGVDIPAIEFIIFLRPVKSRILWVQMLGRGTRLFPDINKVSFKIFDCFGGSLVEYFADTTDFKIEPSRQETIPIQGFISNIVNNVDRDYYIKSLTKRLHRIDRGMNKEARERFAQYIPDGNMGAFASSLGQRMKNELGKTIKLLESTDFQELLDNYPRAKKMFWVAEEALDLVSSRLVIQGKKPEDYLDSFYRFIQNNADQIEAIAILRNRPQGWKAQVLEELRQKLTQNKFKEQDIQRAYQLVHERALADIISLIKWGCGQTEEVFTAQERVDLALQRIKNEKTFTSEQLEWLGYIQQHLVQNLSIEIEDFDDAPILEGHGGKGKANRVFDGQLEVLINDLNTAIAA